METTDNTAISLDGIIIGYSANKHGDIDSLEIEDQDKPLKLNFPPHTAKVITNAAHKGDPVSVTYEEKKPEHDPKGNKKSELKLLTLRATAGAELVIGDIKPQKPSGKPVPENLTMEHFELLKGKKGELFGIRYGKQLVHIHKEDRGLGDKIKPHSRLEITAIKRTDEGFINENQEVVYHIQKVIVDGQEYSTKK